MSPKSVAAALLILGSLSGAETLFSDVGLDINDNGSYDVQPPYKRIDHSLSSDPNRQLQFILRKHDHPAEAQTDVHGGVSVIFREGRVVGLAQSRIVSFMAFDHQRSVQTTLFTKSGVATCSATGSITSGASKFGVVINGGALSCQYYSLNTCLKNKADLARYDAATRRYESDFGNKKISTAKRDADFKAINDALNKLDATFVREKPPAFDLPALDQMFPIPVKDKNFSSSAQAFGVGDRVLATDISNMSLFCPTLERLAANASGLDHPSGSVAPAKKIN